MFRHALSRSMYSVLVMLPDLAQKPEYTVPEPLCLIVYSGP